MYSLKTIDNLYAVVDEQENIVASYQYRAQAKDHFAALREDVEFIPRSIEIYQDLG
jgi:hypothetical protein